MTLRNYFHQSLSNIYPEYEIDAIFYLYIKEKHNLDKHEYVLNNRIISLNKDIENDVALMVQNTPVQYVIGYAQFLDLKLEVDKNVLIPRPETEELVSLIIEENKENECPRVLDIGTGSGAIAIALKKYLNNSEVFASDVSLDALKIARKNTMAQQLRVMLLHHNILEENWEIMPKSLDIVVSNPPYIPISHKEQLHPNVTQYEPELALWVPDENPLLFYKKIIKMADQSLSVGGKLYLETHEDYHTEIMNLLEKQQFSAIQSLRDLNNKPRFITAQKIYITL